MKTTKKHFEIFKKECEKWIKVFGLYGWKFYYRHENRDDARAYCVWPDNIDDTQFTIILSVDFDDSFTIEDIKLSAFHEIMEAFLYRITYFACARFCCLEDIREEKHHIIRTPEHVIFKKT